MNLCFIYPFYPPEKGSFGIGTFIWEFTHAIALDRKNQVTVISRTKGEFKTEIIDGINLYRVPEEKGKIEKIVNSLTGKKSASLFLGFRISKLVSRLEKQKRFDIIESCDFGGDSFYLFLKNLKNLVLRCHSPSFLIDQSCPGKKPVFPWITRSLEKLQIEKAANLVFPSAPLFEEVSKFCRIKVKPAFLKYQFIKPEGVIYKKHRGNKILKVLFVGRLEELKGTATFCRAVLDAIETFKIPVRATLIGPDTSLKGYSGYQDYLMKEVIPGKYRKFFDFQGFLPRSVVMKKYKDFDLLIVPSGFESVGYVVLEAMANDLPVIAARTGGLPYLVEDGKTGFLYQPADDYKKIAQTILSIYKKPDLLEKTAKAGLEKVKKEYTLNRTLEENLSYYQRICRND